MSDQIAAVPSAPPAGWYNDTTTPGRQRWFDGSAWTEHYQGSPTQAQNASAPTPGLTDSRKARDKAVYTRQQKGHSLVKHVLLGIFVLWINVIYLSVSPNHYWHA
jgi:hypothetical protein